MHQALYRKYRPNSFDSVYGQDHITSILRHEALNDSISHAYLFSGSRGTGKTTCAKILAKSVNCLNLKDGNPCNECANCIAIDEGTTTDVIEMDAATNTGVDYIRDLRENVMFTPAMLKKRVYIIDEAHMLSDSAFNALLKTIEEPPEHVLYIFATTEQHKIPATIISRCQRFEFRRISLNSLVERLLYIAKSEKISLTVEGAKLIAKTAQGGMRDAISLMELCSGSHKEITPELVNEILGTSSYEKMANVAIDIANKSYGKLFDAINEVVSSSKDILVFFQDLTSFYRDMMVKKSAPAQDYLELLPNEDKALCTATELFNMATLIYHTTLLDEAYSNMLRNPANKRLCAEITLMKMCDPRLNESNDALLSRIASLEDKITLLSKGALVQPNSTDNTDVDNPNTNESYINTDEVQNEISKEENISFGTSTFVDSWEEVIAKVASVDISISSILKTCKPAYSQKNNKFYIIANQFNLMILNNGETKKKIFDALICCDVDISSPSQLEIVTKNIKADYSDLDEF
ncbi:MAG: DNA polymerase III subunit gamma/tau [Clostridia bacterium]|nr:DNA polymerase III subunit gamma/tau [Clostridia bacterium]